MLGGARRDEAGTRIGSRLFESFFLFQEKQQVTIREIFERTFFQRTDVMLGVAEGVNEIEGNSRSRERKKIRTSLVLLGIELEDKKEKRKTLVDTFFVSIPLPSLDEATFFSFKQCAGLSSFDRASSASRLTRRASSTPPFRNHFKSLSFPPSSSFPPPPLLVVFFLRPSLTESTFRSLTRLTLFSNFVHDLDLFWSPLVSFVPQFCSASIVSASSQKELDNFL